MRKTIAALALAASLVASATACSSSNDGRALPDSVCWGLSGKEIAASLGQKQSSPTIDWHVAAEDTATPGSGVWPNCRVYYTAKGTPDIIDGYQSRLTSRELLWQAAEHEQLAAMPQPLTGFAGKRSAWLRIPECAGQKLNLNTPMYAVVAPITAYDNPGRGLPGQELMRPTVHPAAWATSLVNRVRQLNGCTEAPLPAAAEPAEPGWSPVASTTVCGVPVPAQIIAAAKVNTESLQTSDGEKVCLLRRETQPVLVYGEFGLYAARDILGHESLQEVFNGANPLWTKEGDRQVFRRLDLPLTDGSQAVFADTCTGGSGTELYVANIERSDYPLDALRRAMLDAAAARDGCAAPR